MQRNEKVRDYLDSMIRAGKTPGLQYIVVNQDDVLFSYTKGFSDIAGKSAVNEKTTVRKKSEQVLVFIGIRNMWLLAYRFCTTSVVVWEPNTSLIIEVVGPDSCKKTGCRRYGLNGNGYNNHVHVSTYLDRLPLSAKPTAFPARLFCYNQDNHTKNILKYFHTSIYLNHLKFRGYVIATRLPPVMLILSLAPSAVGPIWASL